MGMFGPTNDEFQQLQSEIAQRFTSLEGEVRSKVTDSEEAARSAAQNAAAYESEAKASGEAIETALREMEQYKSALLEEINLAKNEREELSVAHTNLMSDLEKTQELFEQLTESKAAIDEQAIEIAGKIKDINSYLEQSEELPESLSETQKILEEVKGLGESINNILSHSVNRKSEIDDLYKKILGEDIKSADGKVEHIDGLKDDLERTYGSLSDKATGLEGEVQRLVGEITANHVDQRKEQLDAFESLINESKGKVDAVHAQLTSLLPGAMAEGLSAAYEQKKADEVESLKGFEKSFKNAIYALVGVSLIPFAVDIYLLAFQNKNIVDVIKDTPSLIVAIFPLYFPVLWLAYATNKKLNLSKRLIEEYTHKSVLGKTFSGLSNQIDTLPHQGEVKEELRTRLLFNVLQVSAENPGKLITNYNKADHPIMEALENSAKLSDSVEALAKIPGFSAIAKKLSDKGGDFLKEQEAKVERGLAAQDSLEAPAEKRA